MALVFDCFMSSRLYLIYVCCTWQLWHHSQTISLIIRLEISNFCVQQRLNSDPLPGQLSSNSAFIGKQNPELCQLSFICVYLQHLTLAPNHPSHDTAAPQGLPLCTNPASILMSLLLYLSPALALWFFPNHHEWEHSDLVEDGRLLRTFRNIHVVAHEGL